MALPWEAIKHYSKDWIFLALKNSGLLKCSHQCLLLNYEPHCSCTYREQGNDKTIIG